MTEKAHRQMLMSKEEIQSVFETLNLPKEPKPVPVPAANPGAPVVFFTQSGHTPPPITPR